jgi:transcriptional regulator GlxA family with amidase domain
MTTKKIGIIVFDGVLTSEVIAPAEVFGIARRQNWFTGWELLLIGVENQPTVTTAEGITLGVDATISDDMMLDVLLVPGAYEMDHLLQNEPLNDFIRRQEETAQWMGSNCSGAFLLAQAGVLAGKRATTWFGGEAQLQAQFPEVQVQFDAPVVLDNRRVTANGGLVSYRAALVLLAQLSSPEQAHQLYEALHIDRLGSWVDVETDLGLG